MKYARLYADKAGESHFEDVDVELAPAHFTPLAPPVGLSEMAPAEHVGFLTFPAGWEGPCHVAPAPMLLFVLGGELEIIPSDGDARRFSGGTTLALEDTEGKGHVTRVVGDQDVRAAFAGLAD